MQYKNFDLEILSLDHAQIRLDYYSSNKEHLEIWHPTTPKGFYTLEYQRYKIKIVIGSSTMKNIFFFLQPQTG